MNKQQWKILSSEYLVRAPWAVLRKDSCEMPNGHIVPEYYVLEYPNWVSVVGVTTENEIILVKQYRHGVGKSILEIPGGVIDEGEDSLTAAKREMLEETGYQFDSFDKICELYPNPATSNNKNTTYLALGGKKVQEQELDTQEDIDVMIVSIDEVKALVLQNKIGQSLHTSSLFYALLKLERIKG